MGDDYHGDMIALLINGCVVVERADPVILATNELIEEWRAGTPHVQLDGDVATLGTEGQGMGRVSYQIGGRYDQHTRVLTRVEPGQGDDTLADPLSHLTSEEIDIIADTVRRRRNSAEA
jgi:hypothetical protein